jgi:hypothetical protein
MRKVAYLLCQMNSLIWEVWGWRNKTDALSTALINQVITCVVLTVLYQYTENCELYVNVTMLKLKETVCCVFKTIPVLLVDLLLRISHNLCIKFHEEE